jgi:hypothetical protein
MMHLNYKNGSDKESHKTGELYCTLCGRLSHGMDFKNGHICDNCLKFVKTL